MKLVLKQKQQLNLMMTTELKQAIALLQYSTEDIYDYLKEQELENPLIELVEKHDSINDSKNKKVESNEDYIDPLDFVANKNTDIRETLINQLNFESYPEKTKQQLSYLILNLDDNGYLSCDKTMLKKQLNINDSVFKDLIVQLQSLEPIGIGAINLVDCLKIQLDYYYPDEHLAKKIVSYYFTELAHKRWQVISTKENVSLQEIDNAFMIIKSLNPRPIGGINEEAVNFVAPDIIVKYDEEIKAFTIILNDHYIPDIQFNQISSSLSSNEKEYINNQFKKYQWLKNSIEQRRQTITKIMHVLLNKQKEFFKQGLKSLNPLTLKEVANLIDMHESTVSRATDNKIIQTPCGTYELKKLFSTRLNSATGEDVSQTQVKNVLTSLVKNENKYKPLSDQKLAERIEDVEGIKISRRTIAKYRDELNVPSSSKRKEVKI